LAARYGLLSAFVESTPEKEREALAEVHGIGPKIAESVAAALKDERFIAVLSRLIELGINPRFEKKTEASGPLINLTFCVTGTLSRPREAVHESIRNAGGTVHKAVSSNTNFLVVGAKVGQSKIKKAEALGTKVIDEETLTQMIAG
jgi:DNA ligase (NAD+)